MKAKQASRRRRGSIGVLAAAFMVVLAGMIAFGIDCGMITLAREQLQNAADCAAIAGADTLPGGPGAALAAAQSIAQSNSAGGGPVAIVPAQDIQLGIWDTNELTFTSLSGSAREKANAVCVTCRMSQARGTSLRLLFAPVFGVSTTEVSAQAIALMTNKLCGPFIGLNSVTVSGGSYTDSYESSQGTYSESSAGDNGTVCSNGDISISGASSVINGDAHPGAGDSVATTGGSSVTGSTAALTQPLNEPAVDPGSAATANQNAKIPVSALGQKALDEDGNFSLSGGDSVTLPPGVYYFSSLKLAGDSSVVLTGQTIIYCQGDVNLGGDIVNTCKLPAACQIYAQGSTVALSGQSQFYGLVYAPTANITYSAAADFFGMLIGASLTLSGGGGFHADESFGPLAGVRQPAQLVQ